MWKGNGEVAVSSATTVKLAVVAFVDFAVKEIIHQTNLFELYLISSRTVFSFDLPFLYASQYITRCL